MASLERTPSTQGGTPKPIGLFEVSLQDAARRIDLLERERVSSNRAINELLLRAGKLEHDAAVAATEAETWFHACVSHVEAQTERVRAENAALSARIHALQARRLWRFANLLRRLRARFR